MNEYRQATGTISTYMKRFFLESLSATEFFLCQTANAFEEASCVFEKVEDYLRKTWKDD